MKTHPVYLMFTNDTETYQGLKLMTGRNTDTNKELAQSRLYFTDVMHLLYLHDFDSVYVREVILPEGERVVKMDSKYRAENIILGNRHDLSKLSTWKWLVDKGLDVTDDNNYAIRRASLNGNLGVVEYLESQGARLP